MNPNISSLPIGFTLKGDKYSYRIIGVLGNGAFGITYRATVRMEGELGGIDVPVAIKEFFMHEINGRDGCTVTSGTKDGLFQDYMIKFVREAKNLSKLKHPNIIKVLESFRGNGTVYYTMEFVDGGDLDHMISAKGVLAKAECIRYALQIAEALKYMHANGMLHLDLKPNNIMMKGDTPVLIDFGLAKQYNENGVPDSSTTVGAGTVGYAPIEQSIYRDGKDFPVTMDIYAFGATMFKMLTGHRPPASSDILNDGFPDNDLRKIHCSSELTSLIQRCMHPLKKERIQSIGEVVNSLRQLSKKQESITEEEEMEIVADVVSSNYGFYRKHVGEKEYGTWEEKLIPVTDPMPFPDESIYIKYYDYKNKDISYEIWLRTKGTNQVCAYKGSIKVIEKNFQSGIANDVKSYLIDNGFLSKKHWELEEVTGPFFVPVEGCGVDVGFCYLHGTPFYRKAKYDSPRYNNLFFEVVDELLRVPSLATIIPSKKEVDEAASKEPTSRPLIIGKDTEMIEVKYHQRTPFWRGAYELKISPHKVSCATPDAILENGECFTKFISSSQYEEIRNKIMKANIWIRGREIPYMVESEDPETLSILLHKKGKKETQCYWKKQIGRCVYGNMEGDIDVLKEFFANIVPELNEYINGEDRNQENDKKKAEKRGNATTPNASESLCKEEPAHKRQSSETTPPPLPEPRMRTTASTTTITIDGTFRMWRDRNWLTNIVILVYMVTGCILMMEDFHYAFGYAIHPYYDFCLWSAYYAFLDVLEILAAYSMLRNRKKLWSVGLPILCISLFVIENGYKPDTEYYSVVAPVALVSLVLMKGVFEKNGRTAFGMLGKADLPKSATIADTLHSRHWLTNAVIWLVAVGYFILFLYAVEVFVESGLVQQDDVHYHNNEICCRSLSLSICALYGVYLLLKNKGLGLIIPLLCLVIEGAYSEYHGCLYSFYYYGYNFLVLGFIACVVPLLALLIRKDGHSALSLLDWS